MLNILLTKRHRYEHEYENHWEKKIVVQKSVKRHIWNIFFKTLKISNNNNPNKNGATTLSRNFTNEI